MSLHPSVKTSYGSAFEATQASSVPSRAMTPPLPALSRVLIRRPFRDAFGVTIWFDRTSPYYSRSIAMTALHKPERATYGQAVEAQREYAFVICHPIMLCAFEGNRECIC